MKKINPKQSRFLKCKIFVSLSAIIFTMVFLTNAEAKDSNLSHAYHDFVESDPSEIIRNNTSISFTLLQEIYTESLRNSFEPYPRHAKEFIQNYFSRRNQSEAERNSLVLLKNKYEKVNRTGRELDIKDLLSYCKKNSMLLCQADMSYRLAQFDYFSKSERISLLNDTLDKSEQLSHRPLNLAARAQQEYLSLIQSTGYGDHWRRIGPKYIAQANKEKLFETLAIIELTYSLEELHEHKGVCNADFILSRIPPEHLDNAHKSWWLFGLAQTAYQKGKYSDALKSLQASKQSMPESEWGLKGNLDALEAWLMWRQGGDLMQIKELVTASNRQLYGSYSETVGRNNYILALLETESEVKENYLSQSVSAFIQAKDVLRERYVRDTFNELQKSQLHEEIERFAIGLSFSEIPRHVLVGLDHLNDFNKFSVSSHLLASDDQKVRQRAFTLLSQTAKPEYTPVLLSLLKHKSPFARSASITALNRLGNQNNVPYLIPLLHDEDIQVQLTTILALKSNPEKVDLALIKTLFPKLTKDQRQSLIKILLMRPDGLDFLKKTVLQSSHYHEDFIPYLEKMFYSSLTQEQGDYLILLLKSENRNLAVAAANALKPWYSTEREKKVLDLFDLRLKDHYPALLTLLLWNGKVGLRKANKIIENGTESSLDIYIRQISSNTLLEPDSEIIHKILQKNTPAQENYWNALGTLMKYKDKFAWDIFKEIVSMETFSKNYHFAYKMQNIPCHDPMMILKVDHYFQRADKGELEYEFPLALAAYSPTPLFFYQNTCVDFKALSSKTQKEVKLSLSRLKEIPTSNQRLSRLSERITQYYSNVL